MEESLSLVLPYCPRCGKKLNLKKKSFSYCLNCGMNRYFNPLPTSTVILINADNKLLFIRRKNNPSMGKIDFCGGFIDKNETAEEAAIREIYEETGLKIEQNQLRYVYSCFGTYKYQAIPYQVLDIVFTTFVDVNSSYTFNTEEGSLEWYDRSEVNLNDLAFSNTRKELDFFLRNFPLKTA